MAAPSIPNLLTRPGRGRRGARAGRGGDNRRTKTAGEAGCSTDAIIQDTDIDAAVSRLSAVSLGYLDDPFAALFVSGAPTRRLPIINRGTYMRTRAIDMMIEAFLSEPAGRAQGGRKQIISLGAGTDSRPFRLLQSPSSHHLIYHEIDFESTCKRKYQAIRYMHPLKNDLQDVETAEDGSWSARSQHGGEYHCHAADLRCMQELLVSRTKLSTVRADVPTLILSECCLCYLTLEESRCVLNLLRDHLAQSAALLYEPMPLDDAFGEVMLSNLRARQIHMPSIEQCRDPKGQEHRLRSAGYEMVGHATMGEAWDRWIAGAEKERVDALEGLDELEEWQLLAAHYVVAWGSVPGIGVGEFGSKMTARASLNS